MRSSELYSVFVTFSADGTFCEKLSHCSCQVGVLLCCHQLAVLFTFSLLLEARLGNYESAAVYLGQFPDQVLSTQQLVHPIRNHQTAKINRKTIKPRTKGKGAGISVNALGKSDAEILRQRPDFLGNLLAKLKQIILNNEVIPGFPTIERRRNQELSSIPEPWAFSSTSERADFSVVQQGLLDLMVGIE